MYPEGVCTVASFLRGVYFYKTTMRVFRRVWLFLLGSCRKINSWKLNLILIHYGLRHHYNYKLRFLVLTETTSLSSFCHLIQLQRGWKMASKLNNSLKKKCNQHFCSSTVTQYRFTWILWAYALQYCDLFKSRVYNILNF